MAQIDHTAARECLLIALVVGATTAGSYFAIWRKSPQGCVLSGCLLIAISGTLALHGEHPIGAGTPAVAFLSLVVGLSFGLTFPCCAPTRRFGALQVVGAAAVIIHCALDGHVVQEATSWWLIALLAAHKFQDGADGRLVSSDRRSIQILLRVAVVAATPVGLLLLPKNAVDPILDSSLFSSIIGLNLGSAFHLFRHAAHLRQEQCAAY